MGVKEAKIQCNSTGRDVPTYDSFTSRSKINDKEQITALNMLHIIMSEQEKNGKKQKEGTDQNKKESEENKQLTAKE